MDRLVAQFSLSDFYVRMMFRHAFVTEFAFLHNIKQLQRSSLVTFLC